MPPKFEDRPSGPSWQDRPGGPVWDKEIPTPPVIVPDIFTYKKISLAHTPEQILARQQADAKMPFSNVIGYSED